MNMLPGDWIVLGGMLFVLVPMIAGHWLANRRTRRQPRDPVRGHPARQARATRDGRVTEQVRS